MPENNEITGEVDSSSDKEHGQMKLTFSLPKDMSDEDAEALCVKAVRLLNAAYKEMGGEGLTVDESSDH